MQALPGKMSIRTVVMHLDGDSFFASCELLRRRDLRGKPAVVGEERGIATAMNAEAKKIGIERGEPIFKIRQKFGTMVAILPCHFDLYHHIASATYYILTRFSTIVEAYSIDECFIDFSHIPDAELESKAHEIQNMLFASLGIWYSCGVARTKALSKLASKRNKPRGVCVVRSEDESHLLETTAVENIWGIGRRLAPKLRGYGIENARQFRDVDLALLGELNSKTMRELQAELGGRQCLVLAPGKPYQKSVETTRAFGRVSHDPAFILSEFSKNIETVCDRLVQLGVVGNRAQFFVRTDSNYTRTYGETDLGVFTRDAIVISSIVIPKFARLLVGLGACKGTGVSIGGCIAIENRNRTLFEESTCLDPRYVQRDIQPTVKRIRDEHGTQSVMLASSMGAFSYRSRVRESRDSRDDYIYGLPLPYLGPVE